MIIGTIATICIQSYTAYSNYKKNRENVEKIKEMQHEYKLRKQKRGLERDSEKFRRSCEFQIKMEEEEHKYRMESTQSKYIESINSLIQKQELRDYYPLVISPQIISNSILPTCLDEIDSVREHILCILTSSNNALFNKIILADLDNYLCKSFSKYWNMSSQHQVCYYTNVWRKDKLLSYDASDWNNLRPLISSPTLFITPLVTSSNDITIRITLIVNGAEFHCDKKLEIKFNLSYNSEVGQIKEFKSQFEHLAYSQILCDAAFVIDSHYWRNHKYPPRLPRLLASNLISLKEDKIEEYLLGYDIFYRNIVLGQIEENATMIKPEEKDEIRTLSTISQFNYPQRSVSYLQSIFPITKNKEQAEALVNDTLNSICEARVLVEGQDYKEIDISQFDVEDINAISKLANLAKSCELNTLEITKIIQQWICKL